jgi:bifunctional non-homologous end joining protein LigD
MNEQSLDRIVFPDDGFTRLDLIEYYGGVASLMLPHIENRPLKLQRFHGNIQGECIFDNDAAPDPAGLIQTITVRTAEHLATHAAVQSAAGLRRLAELGCVTPYAVLSPAARLDNPLVMTFDLDPSADNFIDVGDMAIALRDILALLGLKSYAMTTGSRGVHVTVPLDGSAGFDMVRQFAVDVARGLVDAYPDVVTTYRTASREGMVFVDTSRNAYAQAAVVPYAVRAIKGAPIAAPLTWDELADAQLHSQSFNLRNMRDRLERRQDPWKSMWAEPQSIVEPRKTLDSLVPTIPGAQSPEHKTHQSSSGV